MKGKLLADLTWVEAESALTPESLVVLPLGAAAKEHGPHLRLNNDLVLVEHIAQQVLWQRDVIVAPAIPYFFYPAFVEYPGSITLSLPTATAMIEEICLSLASFGPRRFYVINTGVSTVNALHPAAASLQRHGCLLHFTDLEGALQAVARMIGQQAGGSHADEIETSIMLHLFPARVDMARAAKDFHPASAGRLTRSRQSGFCYSPSGVWGDATLATADKGKQVVQSVMAAVLRDIDDLRQAHLPNTSSENRLG